MYSLKTKIRTVLASVVAVPLLCGMMSLQAYAQSTTQKINLDNVTVFLRGAELFNSGSVRLPAGESEVVFTNVAGRINEQSLSISASNGVMVLSSGIRNDYLVDENLSPKAQEIQKELDAVKAEREGLQIQLSVIQEQLAVLEANRQLAQSDGRISAAEIGKMLDLISTRMTAALKQQVQLNLDVSKLDERIGKLEQQLDEERNKGYQPGGQVVVKFYAPQATTSQVRMSYVVNDAGWVPAYDLHVPKVGAPVNVTYKANVFQNTGINWDKVNLTLSTGNPSQGVQVPTLRPWHIAVARPQPVSTAATASGSVSREYMPQPSPVAMRAEAPTTALYGRIQTNALDGYVTTNAQGVNTSFDIAIPYTVPTDGKGHMILIQSAQVPASYQYVATPKLDQDVFLQARLTDWQNLNLLPGTTNVYFENSFIGQGRIDLNNIKEGLDVSLGRDKRIIVERVEDQNNRGTAGLFGGSAQRTFAYTFNIRNTRSEAVQLVIKDQLPVSRDSEVTLNDLKLAGGVHDDKTGEVKWTLSLKAGEQRNITYSYVVRYPKDANITGL
ncbi:hypothetical protein CUZ56_01442 [Saezia sanguinis]|uniref:Mucoidy inhibitor MuiA family protein n=1 Tax=Saezia sanguinis TaxID=1965230 RepID=A0A433SFI5_9BURK|nr:mucoidy inhibitor MuiA family protein [Saezia sanguinis]RUS67495.1 hypothetical protein CUZ56_01442 [Saezia sanguinis]